MMKYITPLFIFYGAKTAQLSAVWKTLYFKRFLVPFWVLLLVGCGSSPAEVPSGLFSGNLLFSPLGSGVACDQQTTANSTLCCPPTKAAAVLIVKLKNAHPVYGSVQYTANRWDAKMEGNELVWDSSTNGSDLGCPAILNEHWSFDAEKNLSVSSNELVACADGNQQISCSYRGQVSVLRQ